MSEDTTNNQPQLPEELLLAAKNKQLIPIIGAGVSMSVTRTTAEDPNEKVFPSWKDLLLRAADEVAKQDEDQATMVRICVKKQKWQRATEDAQEELAGEHWHSFLTTQFDIDHTQLNPLSASLPKAIWRLSDNIISLNYDKIQQHFSESSTNVTVFDNTNADQLANFAASNQPAHKQFIWHLHGHIDAPSNIVLTPLSYQALYEQKEQAAIEKLKSLVISHRILFIGCSLDDAELIAQIAEQQQLFGQSSKTHYALLHVNDKQAIEQKLKGTGAKIKLIPFADFGQPLIDLIDSISAKPPQAELQPVKPKKRINNTADAKTNHPADSNPILLLTANPLDWLNDDKTYNADRYKALLKVIEKSPYGITHKPLTADNLLNADDYQHVVIASRIEPNNRILIESEYLHSDSVCLTQMLNQLEGTSGVFYILENQQDIEHTLPTIDTPVVFEYTKSEKQTKSFIGAFISQWLKRFKAKFFERQNLKVINQNKFKPLIQSGKQTTSVTAHKSQLPSLIDPNNLKNFIGRNDILQKLATALVNQQQSSIITIKGQGGMGKTTLAKKLAIALAQHNVYPHGIAFIDCESIDSFAGFVRQIAESFNLGQVQNPLEQIDLVAIQNKLLILDNFETILALSENKQEQKKEKEKKKEQAENESRECINLVKSIYPKCNILITSRESLGLENTIEDVHDIEQLSAVDAKKLFINLSGNKIKGLSEPPNNELLTNILAQQLNHNPLAITLICQNLIAGDNLESLHKALLANPFAELTQDQQHQFANDSNSDRLKSIYNSIKYSYDTLSDSEQSTFELLSLFPDGLEYQTFERFVQNAQKQQRSQNQKDWRQQNNQQTPPTLTKSAITRNAIKTFTNKSLLENNQGHIGLQSLIGKFAELQLQKRPNPQQFYQQLLNHMQTFVNGLKEEYKRDESSALKTFNSQYNNILKAIGAYTQLNPNSKTNVDTAGCKFTSNQQQAFDKLLIDISFLATISCNQHGFINALQNLLAVQTCNNNAPLSSTILSDSSIALIQSLLIYAHYYDGEFRASFDELQQNLPFADITTLYQQQGSNLDGNQEKILVDMADIYSMEGHALTSALVYQQIKRYDNIYSVQLFYLGEYQQQLADNSHLARPTLSSLSIKAFFIIQNAQASQTQIATEKAQAQIITLADQILTTLAESNHLDRIQILYFKSQYTKLALTKISALVEVNPFTTGLKQLMLAFNTLDESEQQNLYLQAIENLEHIKYYWVEAKWHYVKFLIACNKSDNNTNNNQIPTLIAEGQGLCQQYHFRYIHYRFDCLQNQINDQTAKAYNSTDYPLPGNPDFTPLINGNNKEAKRFYRTYKTKN